MKNVYLGVDWGRRRVGVAVSDELGRMAHPVSTLESHSLAGLVQSLVGLARERGAMAVVLGLPRHMNGTEGESAGAVRKFAVELEAAGYHAIHNGQKTYNGVAILSHGEMSDVVRDIPDLEDPQKRVIACTVDGVRIVCAYMPNGQAVASDKYEYKLRWLSFLQRWILNHGRKALVEILGDRCPSPHPPVVARPKVVADIGADAKPSPNLRRQHFQASDRGVDMDFEQADLTAVGVVLR